MLVMMSGRGGEFAEVDDNIAEQLTIGGTPLLKNQASRSTIRVGWGECWLNENRTPDPMIPVEDQFKEGE